MLQIEKLYVANTKSLFCKYRNLYVANIFVANAEICTSRLEEQNVALEVELEAIKEL